MQLTEHIHILLRQHESICLPGLGAFKRRFIGDDGQQTMLVSFDHTVDTDDGALIRQLCGAEQITADQAIASIKNLVESANTTLDNSGFFNFEGLGMMFKDNHDTYRFIQDRTRREIVVDKENIIPFEPKSVERPKKPEVVVAPVVANEPSVFDSVDSPASGEEEGANDIFDEHIQSEDAASIEHGIFVDDQKSFADSFDQAEETPAQDSNAEPSIFDTAPIEGEHEQSNLFDAAVPVSGAMEAEENLFDEDHSTASADDIFGASPEAAGTADDIFGSSNSGTTDQTSAPNEAFGNETEGGSFDTGDSAEVEDNDHWTVAASNYEANDDEMDIMTNVAPPRKQKKKKKRGLFIILGLLFLVLGGAAAAYFLVPSVKAKVTAMMGGNDDVAFPNGEETDNALANNSETPNEAESKEPEPYDDPEESVEDSDYANTASEDVAEQVNIQTAPTYVEPPKKAPAKKPTPKRTTNNTRNTVKKNPKKAVNAGTKKTEEKTPPKPVVKEPKNLNKDVVPGYYIEMASYRKYADAHEKLENVKKAFASARIIKKGRIYSVAMLAGNDQNTANLKLVEVRNSAGGDPYVFQW